MGFPRHLPVALWPEDVLEAWIDFTIAYSPFFQAIFGPGNLVVKTPADLAGKTVGMTRSAMEDQRVGKIAPAGVDIKRFEDMNGTISAYAAGQVQLMSVGASVAGNFVAKNPQVNEIIAAAKASGELNKLSLKWLGRPLGDLPS